MRQIILDTETTGLYPAEGHRIIEIGCIELINRKLTGQKFHCYINPERALDDAAVKIHGLTAGFLKDKPLFHDIVTGLMEFISGAELIIHNAPFDIGFLDHELKLTKQKWKPITHYCSVIDTLALARQLHAGQKNNLDALCKRYGIDNSQRELHGALLDAHLLAQVYLAMTGGQGSLFDESAPLPESQVETVVAPIQSVSVSELKIISASQEEQLAHEKYLELLNEQGQCLWLES